MKRLLYILIPLCLSLCSCLLSDDDDHPIGLDGEGQYFLRKVLEENPGTTYEIEVYDNTGEHSGLNYSDRIHLTVTMPPTQVMVLSDYLDSLTRLGGYYSDVYGGVERFSFTSVTVRCSTVVDSITVRTEGSIRCTYIDLSQSAITHLPAEFGRLNLNRLDLSHSQCTTLNVDALQLTDTLLLIETPFWKGIDLNSVADPLLSYLMLKVPNSFDAIYLDEEVEAVTAVLSENGYSSSEIENIIGDINKSYKDIWTLELPANGEKALVLSDNFAKLSTFRPRFDRTTFCGIECPEKGLDTLIVTATKPFTTGYIDLSSNNLSTLPPGIGKVQASTLYLIKNQISSFPLEISSLFPEGDGYYNRIYFQDNPIYCDEYLDTVSGVMRDFLYTHGDIKSGFYSGALSAFTASEIATLRTILSENGYSETEQDSIIREQGLNEFWALTLPAPGQNQLVLSDAVSRISAIKGKFGKHRFNQIYRSLHQVDSLLIQTDSIIAVKEVDINNGFREIPPQIAKLRTERIEFADTLNNFPAEVMQLTAPPQPFETGRLILLDARVIDSSLIDTLTEPLRGWLKEYSHLRSYFLTADQ